MEWKSLGKDMASTLSSFGLKFHTFTNKMLQPSRFSGLVKDLKGKEWSNENMNT